MTLTFKSLILSKADYPSVWRPQEKKTDVPSEGGVLPADLL